MLQTRSIYLPPARRTSSTLQVKGIMLSQAIEEFYTACRARKLSEHTISDYKNTLKHFLAHVGDMPLKSVTTSLVSAFLASLPHSEKTILGYHIGLSSLWTWSIREGYAHKHIIRLVERPKPRQVLTSTFTRQELVAILAAIKGRNALRDRATILLLLDTGLRASELCGLEYSNIDLNHKQIKVLGKGNKERKLPFSERTAGALFSLIFSEHLKGSAGAERPFLVNRVTLGHCLIRLGNRAGVKNVHPHKFRHTFAVNFLRNGGDIFTLKDMLGHTEFSMVSHYLQLAQVDLDTVHKRASPVENWQL